MQGRMAVVLGVVAVVLVIVGFIGPWWTVDSSGSIPLLSITYSSHVEFGLFGGSGSAQFGSSTQTNTTNYNDAPHVGSVFTAAMIFLALSLLVGIGMVITGAMSGSNPRVRRMGGVLGVLAFILALISSLYVMSALPDAVNTDSSATGTRGTFSGFWGTQSGNFGGLASATSTWSAGWGWYVVLAAAIVFLVAGVALLLARQSPMAPPAPMDPLPPP